MIAPHSKAWVGIWNMPSFGGAPNRWARQRRGSEGSIVLWWKLPVLRRWEYRRWVVRKVGRSAVCWGDPSGTLDVRCFRRSFRIYMRQDPLKRTSIYSSLRASWCRGSRFPNAGLPSSILLTVESGLYPHGGIGQVPAPGAIKTYGNS